MFETMYNAHGVGLAAPQVGLGIRLFVIDAAQMDEKLEGYKKVFINPKITAHDDEEVKFEEGCLSIPGVRGKVKRPDEITIHYLDENFEPQELTVDGIVSRIIQHEYDHIEGILFTEKLPYMKKQLIQSKLKNIMKGKVPVEYPMKFAQ